MKAQSQVGLSMDWPLSKEERRKQAFRCYEEEVGTLYEELRCDPAQVQVVRNEIRRAQGKMSEATADKVEHQLRMTPPQDQECLEEPDAEKEHETPKFCTPQESTPTMDSVVTNLHRLSDKSDLSNGSEGSAADPALMQELLMVMAKILAAQKTQEVAGEMDENEPLRTVPERRHRSTPAPRRLFPDSPGPSALQKKRCSRGPGTPRVRFAVADPDDSDNDTSRAADSDKIATKVRGRRLSRGPDGRSYRVTERKLPKDLLSEKTSEGSIAAAAATAVAGGGAGLVGGLAVGAAAGVPLALFTFGLSIPIGAVFGSGAGLMGGAAIGGKAGYNWSSSSKEDSGSAKKQAEEEKALTPEEEKEEEMMMAWDEKDNFRWKWADAHLLNPRRYSGFLKPEDLADDLDAHKDSDRPVVLRGAQKGVAQFAYPGAAAMWLRSGGKP